MKWSRLLIGFQDRARKAIKHRFGSVYAFEKRGVIPKPTIRGWLREKKPRLPFTPALLTLAQQTDASLNHLLLNEGPPLRGQIATPQDLEANVRAHIEAELGREASPDEIRGALRYLGREPGSDKSRATIRAVRQQGGTDPKYRDVSILETIVNLCRAEIPRIRHLRREMESEKSDREVQRDAAKWRQLERERAWARGEIHGPQEKPTTVRGLRKLTARRKRLEKAIRDERGQQARR